VIYIEINKKFSESHISEFSHSLFNNLKKNPNSEFIFDLTNVEWIANQNLLLLTSLWKYLIETNINFQVKLFKDDFSLINERQARNIVQLWNVWKVYQILPSNDYLKVYFNIDHNDKFKILKNKFHLPDDNIFFDKYGITPFNSLNKIEKYNDFKILKNEIEPIYALNDAISEIVKDNNCEHPFIHNTLSAIITRELYENFLDHFQENFFKTENNWCFLSLALKKKLTNYNSKNLESNFNEEEISETISFFKNKKGNFKNESLIQFSFIDYGKSIVETIRSEYLKVNNIPDSVDIDESNILKFAFRHNTSRHPIANRLDNLEQIIPRGLFDILSIVKRYNGLIVIRSGYGKIFYDFSDPLQNIDQSCHNFGNDSQSFLGNFITIYIPPLAHGQEFNYSSIKPQYVLKKGVKLKEKYISLFEILDKITSENFSKSKLYSKGLEELDKALKSKSMEFIFFDFQGWEFDRRLSKIFIIYLTTTYEINIGKSIIIINPPDKIFLQNINHEIRNLLENLVTFQTHPLPFIYYDTISENLSFYWTGIFNETDNKSLQELLYEIPDLRKDDFEQPENLSGNFIFLDEYGNVKSNLPSYERFLKFYKEAYIQLEDESINNSLKNAIDYGKENSIYICSGNYFTEKYITMDKIILNNFRNNNFSRLLFTRLSRTIENIDDCLFISVTSMNTKILRSMVEQGLIHRERAIFLDNYHQDLKDYKYKSKIKIKSRYILVCELIATGYLTNKIYNELRNDFHSTLIAVGVYINTLDSGDKNLLNPNLNNKIIYLKKDKIIKYDIKHLSKNINSKNIIRINPFTNQPIEKSLANTNVSDIIILQSEDFFQNIEEGKIKVKYLDYYGSIQSYFFDLKSVLIQNGNQLLNKIFKGIESEIKTEIDLIFYPKNSSASYIDFEYLIDKILLNHSIPVFEIERFETNDGYKFPHLSNFYNDISSKKKILIIDDTTNTGNSIQQLIDEIIFLNINEIVVLVLLSRISDEKLEFLSRIKKIKGNVNEIKINILYGCHLNIPTYRSASNPNNQELNWINTLLNIQNLPPRISAISSKISLEISHIPIDDYEIDYKYLPWKGKNNLSKKKLAQTRNEIGKILGHRFYSENFKYFNSLILTDYDFSDPESTKLIEEVISVFLYEPFLFDSFKNILPDVTVIIENFIKFILFDYTSSKNSILYYSWDKQDLVHLFFIVFKENDLVNELNNSIKFKKLISFSGINKLGTLNYIFYKLLKFIPLNNNEIKQKQLSGDIKLILDKTLQDNIDDFSEIVLREIKYFKSFVDTLPTDNSFPSLLSKVTGNYSKLRDDKQHSHAIKAIYDKFIMKLRILQSKYYEELANELYADWEKISQFINDILKLSITFPSFFIIAFDRIEGSNENSLRNIQGYLSAEIRQINKNSDLYLIKEKLEIFKLFFLDKDNLKEDVTDRIYNVFAQITTKDLGKIINSQMNNYNEILLKTKSSKPLIEFKIIQESKQKINIDFPKVYFKEVILKEIITNLEHRRDDTIVEIEILTVESQAVIKISNKKKNSKNKIGGNGLRQIRKLNLYPNKKTSYSDNSLDTFNEIFQQTITFELT